MARARRARPTLMRHAPGCALWRYDRAWAEDPPRPGHQCGPDCREIYDGDAVEALHSEIDRWNRGDTT